MDADNLTPKARAVFDAGDYQLDINASLAPMAAALLRAATQNVFYEETLGMTAYEGFNQALEKINALADELDAAT